MTEPGRYFTEWEDLNYKPYCIGGFAQVMSAPAA